MSLLDKLGLGKRKENAVNKKKVTLTGINLRFGGDVHGIEGKELDEQIFTLDIPFQNKMGSGLLPDNLKGPDMTISSMKVDKPFELVEVQPGLPVDVSYLSKVVFHLRIKAPSMNYTGPLGILFGTESEDNVSVDIGKTVLIDGEKKVKLDLPSEKMVMKKSQIFRRDIQLYNILKFGREISNVSANSPFEIVSTEPGSPFTLDRKDSYVLKVFIKCPDFNYAGPLEINFR